MSARQRAIRLGGFSRVSADLACTCGHGPRTHTTYRLVSGEIRHSKCTSCPCVKYEAVRRA